MNSFWKGFFSLFDWILPSTEEQLNDLDNQMQDLYDRMGWGEYKKPSPMSGWNDACNINRILEAEKQFNNAIDDYLYRTKQEMITYYDHNPIIRDPARKRVSRYYERPQYK